MLQVCLRQEHLQTANCKEFQYIIEAFFDYRLSTIQSKKLQILQLQRNICNK